MASVGVLREILLAAEQAYPDEYCGIVTESGERPLRHRQARNLLLDDAAGVDGKRRSARDAFLLDPAVLFAARRDNEPLLAIVHSHCDAPPIFSELDARFAVVDGAPAYPGVDQLVVSIYQGQAHAVARYRWDPFSCAFHQRELRLLDAQLIALFDIDGIFLGIGDADHIHGGFQADTDRLGL